MKTTFRAKRGYFAIVLSVVIGLFVAAHGQPQNRIQDPKSEFFMPLKLGASIPLGVQSEGVEWKGYSYHLVRLGSIQFNLEQRTNRLTADIRTGVITFDNVDYDISAAVFDAKGRMLGVARAECHVQREWLGRVVTSSEIIPLDFGHSLDYPNATAFMVSVSKRKVLTPDDWQK